MSDEIDKTAELRLARALTQAGVAELGPDDDPDELLPLRPGLEIEHATARAVLFVEGSIVETWVPKAALVVDEPEPFVRKWFVEGNNEWDIVA